MTQEHHRADRAELRRAAERLLIWGFSAPSIARQLRCSQSWIYQIRREQEANPEARVETGSLLNFLGESHT
jgi:hypothetical protein